MCAINKEAYLLKDDTAHAENGVSLAFFARKQIELRAGTFSFAQGIGDSGQGFFNAIIYCLWTKKVRMAYLNAIKGLLRKKVKTSIQNESLSQPC